MARLPGVWGPKPRKGGEEEGGGAGGGGGVDGLYTMLHLQPAHPNRLRRGDGLYTMPHSTASTSRQTEEG